MTPKNFLHHRKMESGRERSWLVAGAIAALCIWISLAGASASAQSNGLGTITGTVTDPAGAVILGAKLEVTDVATNVTSNSVTNGSGYFEIDSLVPGRYKITATAPGFETLLREGITLEGGGADSVALQLKTGSVSQTVTIIADVTLLNTEDGSFGQTLTTQQLEAYPASGSNPAWFLELAPGVQSPFSQTLSTDGTIGWNGVSNFSTFGQQQRSEYSLDGAPNMQGRQNAINPTGDSLSGVKFDVVGFDASVGHTLGATVTQTTKSGANQFHGDIRENYENKRWSAFAHFQGLNYRYEEQVSGCNNSLSTTKFSLVSPATSCLALQYQVGWPGTHENNGALSVGGPISIPKVFSGKDKLFFFASVLDDVLSGTHTQLATVPTVQERSGDFSDLNANATVGGPALFNSYCGSGATFYGQYQIYDPYSITIDSTGTPRRNPICGNKLPASRLLNGAMATVYNGLLPAPNQTNPYGGNYAYGQDVPQTYRDYTGRVDWVVTQSDHAYFRYTRSNYTNNASGFTVGDVDLQSGPRSIDTGAIGWNHVFNAKTNLDVTVGANNYADQCCFYPGYENLSPNSVGLPGYAQTYAALAKPTLPVISVSNYNQIGQVNSTEHWSRMLAFGGNLTRVQGRHTIRAGAEYRLVNWSNLSQGNTSGSYNFSNQYDQENNGNDSTYPSNNQGLSYAAFLMGVQNNASVSQQVSQSFHTPYYALYVGDTWRVTSKLTFIPGIRYEWEAGPVEKHNQQIVGWDPNAPLSISAAANTAFQAAKSGLTDAQLALLPASLTIQGGPEYAGVNGAPTNAWNNSYRFLPRLAAAYQVNSNTVMRGGLGLYFDTLNAEVATNSGFQNGNLTDQDGFSASTNANSSTTFGTNFNPAAPPISNPFPVGSNGSNFVSPIGSGGGSLYYAGQGIGSLSDHNLTPPRQYRGYFGVQHQFGNATSLEVAWLGGLTTNIPMNQPQSPTPASYWAGGNQPNNATVNPKLGLLGNNIPNPFALSNFGSVQGSNPALYSLWSLNSFFTSAVTSIGNLVHPNPQMGQFNINESIGETKYQLVQFTVNRRLYDGLTLMGSLQLTKDSNRDYYANGFDTVPSWEGNTNIVPVRATAEGAYQLPFGRGKQWENTGVGSAILGGFTFSTTWEAQTGQSIGWNNLFYVGQFKASDVKIKKPIYVNGQATGGSNYIQWLTAGNATSTPNLDSLGNFLGTCTYSGTGFVTNPQCQPTGYNLRVWPTQVKGLRNIAWDEFNMNLQRNFSIVKEKLNLETRIEAYNVFNHLGLGGPDTNPTDSTFGQINGDNQPNSRWINISGHLRF
jgi:hypothetical protein